MSCNREYYIVDDELIRRNYLDYMTDTDAVILYAYAEKQSRIDGRRHAGSARPGDGHGFTHGNNGMALYMALRDRTGPGCG